MPLIRKNTTPLWGIWKIDESEEELLSLLDEKEWYLPFLREVAVDRRRKEWLATRVLLKTLLGRETRIAYKATGMPYLPDESYYLSISHTKGYAALLLTQHVFPGIDIEYISERVKKVAFRFMSKDELQQIKADSEIPSLLLYWSGKETIFKALCRENVDFREHLRIFPFKPEGTGSFRATESITSTQAFYTVYYELTPEYVVTYTA